jgi:hypothetical protein
MGMYLSVTELASSMHEVLGMFPSARKQKY